MRVAVLQSNYLPWKGYFDLMRRVDLFVFHDDRQFTKNDWRNRNRIKGPNGVRWLTIPCGTDTHRRICDVRVDRARWQRDHWRLLEEAYARAPYWDATSPQLRRLIVDTEWDFLSELNQTLIQAIARKWLGLATRFDDSRRHVLPEGKNERLIALLRAVGATNYLSGPAARAYIDPEQFARAGIALEFMSYAGYPEYAQLHGPFVHDVSVVDLLFNTGPDAIRYLEQVPASTPVADLELAS